MEMSFWAAGGSKKQCNLGFQPMLHGLKTRATVKAVPLRRNVLIFHQAALGDFIVTWPLAMAMGRMFAQSRIIYVTHSSKGKLAEKVLGVESADVEQGWHLLHAADAVLPETNLKMLGGANLIVSFVSSPGDVWEQNLQRLAPEAKLIQLATNPPANVGGAKSDSVPDALVGHVTDEIVQQLSAWPAIAAGTGQMLRSILDRGTGFRRTLDQSIVIHPGAGKPEKCWPVDRFVEFADRLSKAGKSVRFLLGEAELEKWPAETIEKISKIAQVRRPTTYLDLLFEIALASAFLGNDSGPGHLAAIIGVPTVSLFGSDPTRWRPIGPSVKVIQAEKIETIPVERVQAEILTFDQ